MLGNAVHLSLSEMLSACKSSLLLWGQDSSPSLDCLTWTDSISPAGRGTPSPGVWSHPSRIKGSLGQTLISAWFPPLGNSKCSTMASLGAFCEAANVKYFQLLRKPLEDCEYKPPARHKLQLICTAWVMPLLPLVLV